MDIKNEDFDIPADALVDRVTKTEQFKPVENSDLAFEGECQLSLYNQKEIRRIFHNNEWYFSVIDIISAITDSDRPRQYWHDLKRKMAETEGFVELYEKIVQLKMPGPDGKTYLTDAASVETVFRLIQSVPSPKAEPFKRWLARVAYERIEEFQNPEIAVKRAIMHWKVQGRTDDWIEARMRSIVVRHELTSEWSRRGIKEGVEYAVLTNVISRETFSLDTQEHRRVKGLKKQNLRDHMSDFELVLTMLGEKSTAAIAQTMNAQGLEQNKTAAHSGGSVAGNARKELEKTLGRSVVSKENFLPKKKGQIP